MILLYIIIAILVYINITNILVTLWNKVAIYRIIKNDIIHKDLDCFSFTDTFIIYDKPVHRRTVLFWPLLVPIGTIAIIAGLISMSIGKLKFNNIFSITVPSKKEIELKIDKLRKNDV